MIDQVLSQSWIGIVIVVAGALIYLFSRVRKEDMETLRIANTDLRDSIEDGKSKISGLEHAVNTLEHKVEDLEKKNKSFEDLIITALKQYFFENPSVASQVQKLIK